MVARKLADSNGVCRTIEVLDGESQAGLAALATHAAVGRLVRATWRRWPKMMPGSTWIILTDGISAALPVVACSAGLPPSVRSARPVPRRGRPWRGPRRAATTPLHGPRIAGESPARAQSRLAAQIAAAANDAAARLPVAGLMLVAPGRLLAMVEDGVDPSLRRCIVARIARTLTAVPDVTLRWHLAACLATR